MNKSTRWHFSQVKGWKFKKKSRVHILHNSAAELVAKQLARFMKLDIYVSLQNFL